MAALALSLLLLLIPIATASAEEVAPKIPQAAAGTPAQNPEAVDISGLEEDYWRPNKDELEVVQNRRFQKARRWEVAVQYGIYQGQDFVDSKSIGGSVTYNFTNELFGELSHFNVFNTDNAFLTSVRSRFGFTPDFNRVSRQSVLAAGWTPIYAKFSLLGKKISHFEMYFAPGVGITRTAEDHVSGHFTIGQKFFLTEHLLFRLEWRISKYTDTIATTQGASSKANGGPGFIQQSETTHNIIFGLGVMF